MKTLGYLFLAWICLQGKCRLSAAEKATSPPILLRESKGRVEYSIANSKWKRLKKSSRLSEGASVMTKPGAEADFRLPGSRIFLQLAENTEVRFDRTDSSVAWDAPKEIRITLIRGQFAAKMGRSRAPVSLQLVSPIGSITCDRADFALCASGKMLVVSGKLTVSTPSQTIAVEGGEEWDQRFGKRMTNQTRERSSAVSSSHLTPEMLVSSEYADSFSPYAQGLAGARADFRERRRWTSMVFCGFCDSGEPIRLDCE
jgi:hypothetical protein